MELLNSAYKQEKNNFEVNNNLGSLYYIKDDFKNAIAYYEAALALNSSDDSVKNNLANAYLKNKDLDKAEKSYISLLLENAENWNAYISLGKIYIQTRDVEKALKNLLYVKKQKPDYHTDEVDSLIAVLN